MGSSDKAVKIAIFTVLASAAAYLGYRAYKKRYPFEITGSDSETVDTPTEADKSAFGKLQVKCLILLIFRRMLLYE